MFHHLVFFTLALTVLSVSSARAQVELRPDGVFENRSFTLSSDGRLACSAADQGQLSTQALVETIAFYESKRPGLRTQAVDALVGGILESRHRAVLESHRKTCAGKSQDALCILAREWGSAETAARVLALFYDTGVLVQRENRAVGPKGVGENFNDDQIRAIEKSVRLLPPHLREIAHLQEADSLSAVSIETRMPMAFGPMTSSMIGAVYIGTNKIFLDYENLDSAKSARKYRDLNLAFRADFRVQMIVHEIGHVIDNMLQYTTRKETCRAFTCRRFSDSIRVQLNRNRAAEWPNRWWSAFSQLSEVHEGRYESNEIERFAEFFAQYILIPESLRKEAPEIYEILKTQVFRGIEYRGYESCAAPVVRELSWHEKIFAPKLNSN